MRGNALDVEEFRGKLGNTCAMANLGCQLDYICDELKPKYLGKSVKDFLCWIFGGGDTNPKTRSHFLVAAYTKGYGRMEPVLPVGLPSLSLASSSIQCHSLTGVSTPTLDSNVYGQLAVL